MRGGRRLTALVRQGQEMIVDRDRHLDACRPDIAGWQCHVPLQTAWPDGRRLRSGTFGNANFASDAGPHRARSELVTMVVDLAARAYAASLDVEYVREVGDHAKLNGRR